MMFRLNPRRMRSLFLGTIAIFLFSLLPNTASEAVPPRGSEQDTILQDLLLGRDTSAQTAAARQFARPPGAHPVAAASHESPMHRFDVALRAVRAALVRSVSSAETDPAFVDAQARLLAADLLVQGEFERIARLKWGGAKRLLVERVEAARIRWRAAVDPLLTVLRTWSQSDARARETLKGEALRLIDARLSPSAPEVYGAQSLPQHRPRFLIRAPRLQPDVAPSYASGGVEVETRAEDFASGAEAILSPAVLAQARDLGNDYIAILDFVRSQVRTQWYAGSQKGADETLRTRSGNDIDQASLLIALLRASNAAARYVTGVVEVPVADLALQLGVTEPRVGAALAAAGIAHIPVLTQGRISAFRIEQVWVAAYVPYGHYRGSSADAESRSWIPLMPALKPAEFEPAAPVLTPAAIDASDWIEEFLGARRDSLPWPALREELSARLARLQPPLSLDARRARHVPAADPLLLLPASTPYEVIAVNLESAELLEEQRQWLRVVLRAGTAADSPIALEGEWPLSQLATRRMSLGYVPATVEDQHLANARGGLGQVPAYLLRVRPSIWLDSRPALSGDGVLEVGSLQRLELQLRGPAGSVGAEQSLRAGGIAALALDPQGETAAITEEDAGASDPRAARVLAHLAQRYQQEWSAADADIGATLGATVFRPLPGATLAIAQYHVDEVLGLAHRLDFQGVALDALLRPIEPVSQRGDLATEADWLRVTALHGSALEHSLFEQQWSVTALSADKGLQEAAARAIPRLAMHPGDDTNALLPAHDAVVRAHIQGWLDHGHDVTVPREPLSAESWSGSTWRVSNPATGESGYFLAGVYAGGVTVMPPGLWLSNFAELFANPYGGEPNGDALAGFLIQLDEAAQGQTGPAGEVLERPLSAYVSDELGRPVRGASVAFAVREGGGTLMGDTGVEGPQLVVATDGSGVARVRLRLPQRQQGLGNYFHFEGQEFPQWASENLVDVGVDAEGGGLTAEIPYEAYTLPSTPSALRLINRSGATRPIPGLAYLGFGVEVEDAYGNAISNQLVTISVSDQMAAPTCTGGGIESAPPSGLFLPGSCPGDSLQYVGNACVASSVSLRTRPGGALVNLAPTAAMQSGITLTASGDAGSDSVLLTTAGEIHARPDSSECEVLHWAGVAQWTYNLLGGASLHRTGDRPMEVASVGAPFPLTRRATAAIASGRTWLGWQSYLPSSGTALNVTGAQVAGPRTAATGIEYDLTAGATPTQVTGTLTLPLPPPFSAPLVAEIPPAWVLDLAAPSIEPASVEVSAFQRSIGEFRLLGAWAPGDYIARNATLELLADGEVDASCHQMFVGGSFFCRYGAGHYFDPTKEHRARYAINAGTPFYLQSAETEVKLARGIIAGFGVDTTTAPLPALDSFIARRYPRRIKLKHEIDVPTRYQCPESTRFVYAVGQPAAVSLRFYRLNQQGERGTLGWEALADEPRAEGVHELAIATADLAFGEYEYELRARATSDGEEEVHVGRASNIADRRDSLPLAHSFVKGVDLFSGHAVVSAEDAAVGGRGPGLRFTRTYASHTGDELTFLGRGWNSDLDAAVIPDRCGRYTVTGAAGQGQRFVADAPLPGGDFSYRALHGYHGTLVQRSGGDFDFYAKDGTRYNFAEPAAVGRRLTFIEDPNGNRVSYEYDRATLPHQVQRITDSAGRALEMIYQPVVIREGESGSGFEVRETRYLLTGLRGPLGLRVDYAYDTDGNLASVTRRVGDAPGLRRDVYIYRNLGGLWVPEPSGELRYHHFGFRLERARNDIDGSERRYDYTLGWSGLASGGDLIYLPEQRVRRVTEPDGGETDLRYDGIRGLGPVSSTVTDARENDTVYALNGYGAAETVTDPAGVTRTDWNLQAMQPARVTDALGTVTDYTYDDHGNRRTERVVHANGTRDRSWTFHTPDLFAVPIKDRLRTHTDARGIPTTHAWDARGNALGSTRGGVTERYQVLPNGDRSNRTDGNDETTQYRYDLYGHLVAETDPLGTIRSASFDALGRKRSESDGAGQTTEFEYDGLDRLLLTRHPAAADGLAGPEGRGERSVEYRDAQRQRIETDENGNVSTTAFDAMGRVLSIRNANEDVQTFVYDFNGNQTRATDFRGNPTTFVFDASNRLIERHAPLARTTTYTHDALGHVLGETTAERVSEYRYQDPGYRRTHLRRKLGERWLETVTRFDANGNADQITDPLGRATQRVFDARDRLERLTQPEGRVTTFGYDGADRKTTETLAGPHLVAPQVRQWSYDPRGRERTRTDATAQVWLTDYDAAGNVARRTEPRGHSTNFAYDARHRPIQESGPVADRETAFGYDAVGNRTEEQHANGRHLRHDYDALNRLVASRDLAGDFSPAEFSRIGYDADGNITSRRDGNGVETTFEVDALNRVTAEHRPLARNLGWTHTIHGEIATETDAEGHTTSHEYDALGRKTKTTVPAPFAYETRLFYDDAGNPTSQTNARGFATTWTYDGLDRRITQTDPDPDDPAPAYVQRWMYDAANNVVRHEDRGSIASTFEFDGENRELKRFPDGVRKRTRSYDAAGNLATETDANGNVSSHAYNAANEKISTTRPEGVVETWSYFPWGDVASSTDADGITTTLGYDLRRRVTTETRPHPTSPAITTHEYDGQGNRVATSRPLGAGHRWAFGFDTANRLQRVDPPETGPTAYTYDRADRRTEVTDAEDRATTTTLDALGRPTRIAYANGDAETIDAYDPNSNVVERRDANGQAITSTYDALDRLTTRHYAGAAQPRDIVTETWGYDPNGQITRIEQTQHDATRHVTQRSWDRQSRLDTSTDRYDQTTEHEYDPQDNRTGRIDPEGRTVYQPDRLNRLRGVQPSGESAIAIEYTPAGRIQTQTYPNGATASYAYDAAGRIETITHRQTGVVTATLSYAYDLNGNRSRETQVSPAGTRSTTYTYDRDDRLTATEDTDEAGAITQTAYTLDDVGNRLTEAVTRGGTTLADKSYSYNARHQLTQVTDSVGSVTTTYSYDANGFQTRETTNGQTTTYRPNLQDRLATLTAPTGPPVEYSYDSDGLRVEKRTTVEATRYGYDGTTLRRETNVTNNLLATYDWAAGRVLRTHRTGLTSYAQHDALKSPIRWSRADGGEQGRASYDAWGKATTQTGTLPPIGYTGYYSDAESGDYYAQQRYYRAGIGRFTRVDPWEGDPLRPITLNKYLYATGNPLRFIDPDGRCPMALSASECHTLQAERLGVDPYTREGAKAVAEFETGRTVGQVRGAWNAVKETAQFAADVPGSLIDLVPGVDVGSLDRMGERASSLWEFAKAPVQTVTTAAQAQGTDYADALEAGDYRGAGEVQGNLEGNVGAGAAISYTGAGLTNLARGSRLARVADQQGKPVVVAESTSGGAAASLTYRHQIKPGKVTDIPELKGQIAGQIGKINQIIEQEGIAGLKQRILQYRSDPSIEAAGRRHVEKLGPAGCTECGNPLAWLHTPDMSVGGAPTDVVSKGLLRNNSIIGGQANRIADEILQMPDGVTRVEWELVLREPRVRPGE